jgi:hypothetical protein
MSYNYTLRYKKFDQLLDDIQVDFQNYSLESLIEPQQLIKVAKRVNYDLGLRINTTKETLLEVYKGNVKLPNDFYTLNYALVCDEVSVTQGMPQGTWIEEKPFVTPYQATPVYIDPCCPPVVNCNKCNTNTCSCNSTIEVPDCQLPIINSCTKPRIELNCKGNAYELVQIVNPGITRTYKRTFPIRILENPQSIECGCPNLYMRSEHSAWIRDGYLYTTLKDAVIYISYQGQLEDEEGNLLIPDHDMLNEYYEYALKQRILENLLMNDEPVSSKLQLVEARLRVARNNAKSIVNMPNFAEMKRVFEMNRTAQYGRFYDMFKSFGPVPAVIPNGFIPGINK